MLSRNKRESINYLCLSPSSLPILSPLRYESGRAEFWGRVGERVFLLLYILLTIYDNDALSIVNALASEVVHNYLTILYVDAAD